MKLPRREMAACRRRTCARARRRGKTDDALKIGLLKGILEGLLKGLLVVVVVVVVVVAVVVVVVVVQEQWILKPQARFELPKPLW